MSAAPADLTLCTQAVAAWQSACTDPLPVALEALQNIAADLVALEMAMYPEDGGGLSDHLASRILAGIQNRAEAAAQLVERLTMLNKLDAAGQSEVAS